MNNNFKPHVGIRTSEACYHRGDANRIVEGNIYWVSAPFESKSKLFPDITFGTWVWVAGYFADRFNRQRIERKQMPITDAELYLDPC